MKFAGFDGLEVFLCAAHIADMISETTPRRLKRPRDANQLAKLIVDIATGQVEDRETAPEGKRESSAQAPRDLRDSEKKSTKK